MDSILEIHQLTKHFRHPWTFRRFCALAELSLTLREREIFGLIGHNGAGKTTTFKLLLGLVRPTRGCALFKGRPSHSNWARRQIGFLPEQPYFYDHLSVEEILDFYGQLYGIPRAERHRRIETLSERLHLTAKRKAAVGTLSKGTLQRVGIAQAVLHRPQLVILDEPMSGLDPVGRKEMRELIHSLRNEGATVIFSSHILPDAEALCDRVAILAQGQLQEVVDLAALAAETNGRFTVKVRKVAPAALQALQQLANRGPLQHDHDAWTLTLPDRERVWAALQVVRDCGGILESLGPVVPSLEDRFLRYVGATDVLK